DAIEIAGSIGYPVLLKPLDSNHGRGISGRLDDAEGVRRAWRVASEYGRRLGVAKFVTGRDHRVLVVGGKGVAGGERVPAHVVGAGRSSVRQLIDSAKRDPRRGTGHSKVLTRPPDDPLTGDFLGTCGRTFDTVA